MIMNAGQFSHINTISDKQEGMSVLAEKMSFAENCAAACVGKRQKSELGVCALLRLLVRNMYQEKFNCRQGKRRGGELKKPERFA